MALVVAELSDVEVLPHRLYFDVVFVCDCYQMAPIREFRTGHFFESLLPDQFNFLSLQDLKLNLGNETNDDLESIWVITEMDRLVVKYFTLFQLQQLLILNPYSLVFRESSDVLFAHAYVHTGDAVCVERLDYLLELSFVLVPLHFGHVQVDELAVTAHERHLVLLWTHAHMSEGVLAAQEVTFNAEGSLGQETHIVGVLVLNVNHGVFPHHNQPLGKHFHRFE